MQIPNHLVRDMKRERNFEKNVRNKEREASLFFEIYKSIFDISYKPHEKSSNYLPLRLRYTASREASFSWIKI